MNDKSKAVKWLCLTMLVVAGLKLIPSYILEQERLDIEERALDVREEAILHQKVTPTVSVPVQAGARSASAQML